MTKKRTLLSITAVLSLAFGALFISPFIMHSQPEGEVQAVSEQPAYIPSNYKNMGEPRDVTLLPDGTFWYTDELNGRIVKMNQSGEILRTVGRYGNAEGEFNGWLAGITHDNDGNLYVQAGNFTYKMDFNGGLIKSWGGGGSDDDQYANPSDIYYDAHSNALFISDTENYRIKKVSTDGVFIAKFGSQGSGNGQFLDARSVTTDSNGRIFVVDSEPNARVVAFSPEGNFLFTMGAPGNGDGLFTVPIGAAVRSNGDIVVASAHTNSLQEFNSSGTWIRTFQDAGDNAWQFLNPFSLAFDENDNYFVVDFYHKAILKFSSDRVFISGIRNSGFVSGKLTSPMSIAYDSVGNLYVLDNGAYNGRIQKFTNAGTYLATIVQPPTFGFEAYNMVIKNDFIYVADHVTFKKFDLSGNLLMTVGEEGSGDGQFLGARGIAVDSVGNIYVSDASNHRIQKFDSSGNYLTQWGSWGTAHGQFASDNAGLVIDADDNIYVPDNQINYEPDILQQNTRIEVFNSSGVYLRTIGSFSFADPIEDGKFHDIGGLAFDAEGKLHVSETDANNARITVFNADGTYSHKYGTIGSGVEEYTEPRGLALNPISGNMSVADTRNHRVQLIPSGTRIYNLISSADVLSTAGSGSLVSRYYDPQSSGVGNISSRLFFGDYVVSDFSVNLASDRDWANVNVITLPEESKSIVVNLDPTNAPGISSTHALYIVKQAGQTSVHVCPNATLIEEVTANCSGGYDLTDSSASLSVVTVGGKTYWKVTGLTGTGIMSTVLNATPTPTATTSPTGTPTATTSVTTSVTATPKVTTTLKPTTPVIAAVTLPPVGKAVKGETPSCPSFKTYTVSSTIIKKGEQVKFAWSTVNTEAVHVTASENDFPPVGTLTLTPEQSLDITFTADNGFCTSKKSSSIIVVDTLPWTNTITVGTGLLVVEAALALQQPAMFGNIWLAIAGVISRKKRQTWGIVYNTTTKKPLGRVIIRLLHADKSVADTVVSEANGTFRLTPKKGKYTVTATLPGFTFPSKLITADVDGGFNNLYHGQELDITDTSKGILLSIPLDVANLSEQEKKKIASKNLLTEIVEMGSNLVMFAGFAYGLYVAYLYPHVYNYAILGVYLVVVVGKLLLVLPKKTVGEIKFTNGKPVAGVEIGLFDTEFKNILYRTFTNSEGEYSFVVPNAAYSLKLMDDHYRISIKGELVKGVRIEAKGTEQVRVITTDLTLE